jgi:beta-galactosidase
MLAWAGKMQQVRLSNPALQARLHQGPAGRVLWVLNSTRETQLATVSLSSSQEPLGTCYWVGPAGSASGNNLTVPPRDAIVVRLS